MTVATATGSIAFSICQKVFKHFICINSCKSHNRSVVKVQLLTPSQGGEGKGA